MSIRHQKRACRRNRHGRRQFRRGLYQSEQNDGMASFFSLGPFALKQYRRIYRPDEFDAGLTPGLPNSIRSNLGWPYLAVVPQRSSDYLPLRWLLIHARMYAVQFASATPRPSHSVRKSISL